jgi:hypothetical protein
VATVVFRVDDAWRELAVVVLRAYPTWGLYLGTMAAVGIVLAAWARRQSRAYGAMVACWLVFAWLGPQLAATMSMLIRPVSPRLSMETDRGDDYANAERSAEDDLGRLVAEAHPVSQTEADAAIIVLHDELDRAWRAHAADARRRALDREREWDRQREGEDRLSSTLSAFFPGALASRGASDAAETGRVFARLWRTEVERQQDLYDRLLFDDRPQVNIRARLGRIDRGRLIFVLVRRARPALATLPLFHTPQPTSSSQRAALVETNVLLFIQMVMALGVAMRVSPRRLRPAD